jgi:hypothetical protein
LHPYLGRQEKGWNEVEANLAASILEQPNLQTGLVFLAADFV